MLKSSGRGIFLIRSFMDDVELRGARGRHGSPDGQAGRKADAPTRVQGSQGPEESLVTIVLRVIASPILLTCHPLTLNVRDPLTSLPVVRNLRVREAGETQRADFADPFEVDKKGTIDLVTEVDLAVERHVPRADRASASPITSCSPRRSAAPPDADAAASVLDLRSDRRHDQLRARPADLLRLAGARDRRRARGRRRLRSEPRRAVHGRARRRRIPERRAAARVRTSTLIDALLVTGFPYDVHDRRDDLLGLFGAFVAQRARRAAAGLGGDRSLLRRGRPDGRLLGGRARRRGTSPPGR